MDDYLSKPIDRNALKGCLERHLAAQSTEVAKPSLSATTVDKASLTPVDWSSLLATVGDMEFARELTAQFIEIGRSNLQLIDEALILGDIGALSQRAHEFRGASASMHARGASAAAERLETALMGGHNEHLEGLAQRLRAEFDCAVEFLQSKVA
jgi:HPt (histidine-containing phosphotransfer) domain-containing protein